MGSVGKLGLIRLWFQLIAKGSPIFPSDCGKPVVSFAVHQVFHMSVSCVTIHSLGLPALEGSKWYYLGICFCFFLDKIFIQPYMFFDKRELDLS